MLAMVDVVVAVGRTPVDTFRQFATIAGAPLEVVSLGSTVEFRCEHTGRIQEIMLVYPSEADIERGRVSVMSRIGAALIGLSPNQTISFRNWRHNAGMHTVVPPPFHRFEVLPLIK